MTGTVAHGVVSCPACSADDLEAVSDAEDTNFRCPSCGACWHVELGWVRRVDPRHCPNCPHREECMARFSVAAAPPPV